MKIVLDTNVLISALLSPDGPPAKILKECLTGGIRLCLSPEIFNEYREVCSRKKLHLDQSLVNDILRQLELDGEFALPVLLNVQLPDPDDLFLLQAAVGSKADFLVTGNVKDFPPAMRCGISIVTPTEFWRLSRKR
ncbi:MAG TPA: putative toxin-antitoxin system toxin component, PIN family [Phycisphaerae bacterium]|nr:putative toxin-antitoxin system toxin component, PIN family [Phycisphaerae bacterium]